MTLPHPPPASGQRLFFALWPEPTLRRQLIALQRQCVQFGKPVPPANLHMTLAFLGEVPDEAAACLRERAAAVRFAAFELTVDTLGYFRKPQILWAGPRQVPAALTQLQQQIVSLAQHCLPDWQPGRFTPHLTLARKSAPVVSTRLAPLRLHARCFCLVRSSPTEDGSLYEVLQSYPAG